jgi:solute carrier family 10 (sodium/bile acid cotransporter), member 7
VPETPASNKLVQFLKKRWFLCALLTLITSGLVWGHSASAETVEAFKAYVPTRWVTAFVLLLMSFSMDSKQLKASFKKPAPVILACLCSYGLIPLLGWAAMSLQQTPDFAIGVMIAASVPCTLAACSVWTRKAGGNDAVSLLTTMVTNTACVIGAPFWLSMATGKSVPLDAALLAQKLVFVVLVPTIVGQLCRQPKPMQEFATRNKTPIGVFAQSSILFLVFVGACSGGVQLQKADLGEQFTGLLVVWVSVVVIHLTAWCTAFWGGKLLGFGIEDRIGASFAGSQKTLPIGVYLATEKDTFGGENVIDGGPVPFAVFPILLFHASQLFIDTIIADRLAKRDSNVEPQS